LFENFKGGVRVVIADIAMKDYAYPIRTMGENQYAPSFEGFYGGS